MRSFPFKKIDAFATPASGGNPAAAIYLDSFASMTDGEMQRVARELKGFVSEVGFLAPIAPDAFRMRYFSSEKEVAFCGHATIAICHDLVRSDPRLAGLPRLLLHTNKGVLPVENRQGLVFIHAPVPVFTACAMDPGEICRALGLPESAIDPDVEIGLVNAGNQTPCVPVRELRDVINARPRFEDVQAFCRCHGLDVIAIFTLETRDPSNRLRTRVFAAPFGYLEDPATGSGNAAVAYHLHRLGLWKGEPFRIEQNSDAAHPNLIHIASATDADGGLRVVFGGGAILRIEGHYWVLPDPDHPSS